MISPVCMQELDTILIYQSYPEVFKIYYSEEKYWIIQKEE